MGQRTSRTVGYWTRGAALAGLLGGGLVGQSTSRTVGWQTSGTEHYRDCWVVD